MHMPVTLTLIRYPSRWMVLIALFPMALFHIPLFLNRNIRFYKLLGTGKNGTFDKNPEWLQWGILAVHRNGDPATIDCRLSALYGSFIAGWCRLFGCETCTIVLEPIEGHGRWDGHAPFGDLPKQSAYTGPVAILTRATIRLSRAGRFWAHVQQVAERMAGADGFIYSVGIGELPFIKQATFSVWRDKACMQQFAYQMPEHKDVIRKTHREKWYTEDMFVRFIPHRTHGTLGGKDPLAGIA